MADEDTNNPPPSGPPERRSPDPKSLLGAGDIRLFGVVVEDLVFQPGGASAGETGLAEGDAMLRARLHQRGGRFARIYGFTYEGTFYLMPRPALFLVHSKGEPVTTTLADQLALSLPDALRSWTSDVFDHNVRLDVSVGSMRDIALEQNIDEQGLQSHYSGKLVAGRRGSLVD